MDPRALAQQLSLQGLQCWIDYQNLGSGGLVNDILGAIRRSRVILVCCSDSYAVSKTCVMELNYASYVRKPLVVVEVGAGSQQWRRSGVMYMVQGVLPALDMTSSDSFPSATEFDARFQMLVEKIRLAASQAAAVGLGSSAGVD